MVGEEAGPGAPGLAGTVRTLVFVKGSEKSGKAFMQERGQLTPVSALLRARW